MNIMTKQGSQDNVITYEHFCDTKADLANIPQNQTTLGSTAIVLQDTNGMGIYIANSNKEWIEFSTVGGSEGGSSGGSSIQVLDSGDYDVNTKQPTIASPTEGQFYFVPIDDGYLAWIWVGDKWQKFNIGGTSVQPDWNQNDSNAADYIKNRIGGYGWEYDITKLNEIATASDSVTLSETNSDEYNFITKYQNSGSFSYSFSFDDSKTSSTFNSIRSTFMNNPETYNLGMLVDNTYFFYFQRFRRNKNNGEVTYISDQGMTLYQTPNAGYVVCHFNISVPTALSSEEITIKFYLLPSNFVKIPSSFVSLPNIFFDETHHNIMLNSSYNEAAKLNGSAVNYAFATGDNTAVRANYASAHGYNTIASGESSFAEGNSTIASGSCSHTEGALTEAKGYATHAEGYQTIANNDGSHAEGYNTNATQQGAHAEGVHTEASGSSSHAEGYYTIAAGNYQHVSGMYNISNTTSLEIIGNGTYNARSNARTLDRSGNEWLAGNLSINGTTLTIGSTSITETQLQQLLALLGG